MYSSVAGSLTMLNDVAQLVIGSNFQPKGSIIGFFEVSEGRSLTDIMMFDASEKSQGQFSKVQ